VVLLTSPLSEIAYQLAGTDLASTITAKNAEVAAAFGLDSVDIIGIIPTDINTTTAANDDAGKIATILAAISQMGENSADVDPAVTITALVKDMRDSGSIEGRGTVDVATAINNFKTNGGANNTRNGKGAGNINSSVGKGSLRGNLAIAFIDAFDGTGTEPTVQQYDDAGVTGVAANNLVAVNAAVANQTAGTTAQIQALANRAIGISDQALSIAENSANTTLVGDVLVTTGSPTDFRITSGNTGSAFAISNSGQITVATSGQLDYEITPSYTLVVEITRDDTTPKRSTITINLTDEVVELEGPAPILGDSFVSEAISHNGWTYMTVQSPRTGKIWLDRNIGAKSACLSSSSTDCYGDYFQWGRLADGHEKADSKVFDSTIGVYGPGSSDEFITVLADWGTGDDGGGTRQSMWFDSSGDSVCPVGYNIPTQDELVAEEMGNPSGLFYHNVPKSGYRDPTGAVSNTGSLQILWSRQQVNGGNGADTGRRAWASSSSQSSTEQGRAYGINIRCRRL
jgi:hypothetical protein